MAPSTPTGKSSAKSFKQSKIVTIRLPPDLLTRFPHAAEQNGASQATGTPTVVPPDSVQTEDTPDPNNTPQLSDSKSLAPPTTEGKKKGTSGTKGGVKRSAPSSSDGQSKLSKARPGPKKKPRLADGSIDRNLEVTKKGPFAGPAPISDKKLGPKANTGAINAGLRALDRSGKACRKWERKGFALKSFTGVSWDVGSWAAPTRATSAFSGDVKSDSSSTGDMKPVMESSAVASDASNSGEGGTAPANGVDSSPPRAPIST